MIRSQSVTCKKSAEEITFYQKESWDVLMLGEWIEARILEIIAVEWYIGDRNMVIMSARGI